MGGGGGEEGGTGRGWGLGMGGKVKSKKVSTLQPTNNLNICCFCVTSHVPPYPILNYI